jgi:hypothetical protein
MRTRSLLTIVGVVILGLVVGCEREALPDTPELRMEKARALAALEAGDGGGYEETLDLGASLATDSTVDPLMLELGRELTDQEKLEVQGVMRGALAEVLPPDQWQRAAAEIYAEHLSPADLEAVMEFYTSPVGAKILGLQSTLDEQMGDAVDAIVEQRLEEFIGLVDQGLAELFPELNEGGEG